MNEHKPDWKNKKHMAQFNDEGIFLCSEEDCDLNKVGLK